MTDDDQLFERVVALADIAAAGFDVHEMADDLVRSCVDLLGVTAAGIMLDDQHGTLRVFASTSEEIRLLELMELQNREGLCLDAFATGETIEAVDLAVTGGRWPLFTQAALERGMHSAWAIPMRLRERTVGALNLFSDACDPLPARAVRVARLLADMATIGIINHWTVTRQEALADQLQTALTSRVLIEQAKGIIAERTGLSMTSAFELLRGEARSTRRPMAEVAGDLVADLRQVVPGEPVAPPATHGLSYEDAVRRRPRQSPR